MGTKYLNTGNRPLPSLEFPGYGAVVSKELAEPARPAAVRGHPQDAAGGRRSRRRVRPVQHAIDAARRPAVHGPRHHAGPRPDGREDRAAAASCSPTSTRPSATTRRTAACSRGSTASRSGPTTSSARRGPAGPSTSARSRRRSPSCSRTTRSRRAACWRRGWSRRACGS